MLNIQNLTFGYNKTNVLEEISFSANQGDHISVIGESGSGKSTLLKLIYGEHDLDKGRVFWNDTEILGPKHNLVVGYSFMKYVSQEFDLMPFISVEENVGKFLSNFFPNKKQKRVNELLDIVGLNDFKATKVKLLSGGQKQRVALARAIALKPQLILFDEPFSHIDSFKKQGLRRNLFNYLKENQITCIVATHDKDDCLGFADRIIVLNNSKIIMNEDPQRLYSNPKTSLVASFFGEHSLINNNIVYAHQLQITKHSDLNVQVEKSYFKGDYFLIEGTMNGKKVFFKNPTALKAQSMVFLKLV